MWRQYKLYHTYNYVRVKWKLDLTSLWGSTGTPAQLWNQDAGPNSNQKPKNISDNKEQPHNSAREQQSCKKESVELQTDWHKLVKSTSGSLASCFRSFEAHLPSDCNHSRTGPLSGSRANYAASAQVPVTQGCENWMHKTSNRGMMKVICTWGMTAGCGRHNPPALSPWVRASRHRPTSRAPAQCTA